MNQSLDMNNNEFKERIATLWPDYKTAAIAMHLDEFKIKTRCRKAKPVKITAQDEFILQLYEKGIIPTDQNELKKLLEKSDESDS